MDNFVLELQSRSCPIATQYTRAAAGLKEDRDKEEMYELPTLWSKRSVYARWLNSIGWKVYTDENGTSKVTADASFSLNEGESCVPFCS
mmetsp:Transcript_13845/g.21005  ORF Transcript_13845/g.21005 Transcript_13845/m.21005 type:complete len:89 (+) Transcript_13845:677-943(+)